MLLYRVFPHLPSAPAGRPGHPEYLHRPQGKGRLDNPDLYDVWYLSAEAPAAIGEVFADRLHWDTGMFDFPLLPGSRRALGVYSIPDDSPILDLDDARALLDRALRPTQVIERNRPTTQRWARAIYAEPTGWAGVRWWSYHLPQWRIYGLWRLTPRIEHVEELDLNNAAVTDAAHVLPRLLRRDESRRTERSGQRRTTPSR
jgi:hypothetical protein